MPRYGRPSSEGEGSWVDCRADDDEEDWVRYWLDESMNCEEE